MYAFKHNTTFHTVTDAPRLACIELKLTNQSPVYSQVWLHAAKITLLPLFILLFFLSHGVGATGALLVSWLRHYVVNMHIFVFGYVQSVCNAFYKL